MYIHTAVIFDKHDNSKLTTDDANFISFSAWISLCGQ